MENKKVAIYARLSVEDLDKIKKGDESESIQNQRLLLIDYAKNQGWTIYNIYFDDDYSGLDSNRPAFTQMIKDAEKGEFDIVLCKTQSRFTRDMEIVEKYIHGRFVLWGIRFIGLVDNVDTDVKGNKKARQIYGLINEWYCEDVSENIRAVFKKKMQDGQFLGGFAPYGYNKSEEYRGKLEVDEEAAQVVKRIFSLYLDGYGVRQICDILTNEKVLTPTLYKQSQGLNFATLNAKKYSIGYGEWARNTVRKILQNRMYIGTLVQGREKKVSYKSKKVVTLPKDEWITVENSHEPIIDEKSFYEVQEILKARRIHRAPKDGNYGHQAHAHVLSGKVRCEDCASQMTRSATGRNGDKYLRCALYHKTHNTKKECSPHTIKLDSLVSLIEEKIRLLIEDYLSDDNEKNILVDYCFKADDLKKQISIKEKELSDIEERQEKLKQVITNAYVDKSTGLLSETEFIEIRERLNAEIKEIPQKQSILRESIGELKLSFGTLRNADEVLKQYIKFESLTHAMVRDFIDYIEVGDKNEAGEQKVTIHWLF